jgi:NhaA family Na+:H+ antiporter
MDDLAAIVVIAVFYTEELSVLHLAASLLVFVVLVVMNRFRIMILAPYLVGGALMWILMLKSGVHPTISGVLLAFAIPFSGRANDHESPSHYLEHLLHRPVAFLILPLFSLANTAIVFTGGLSSLTAPNSAGIIAGLLVGKPLGITLASFIAVWLGFCRLPADLNWKHIFGAGLLGGIGFTMSIFITNLAFPGEADVINASKMSILLASVVAGIAGVVWLKLAGHPTGDENDSGVSRGSTSPPLATP